MLKGQVGMLNSLRETQLKHDKTLADHTKTLADHTKTLAEMRSDMRRGFGVLSKGQERITELLEARDDPGEA